MDIPQVATEAAVANSNLVGQLIFMVVLTLINAFFSASEMAMVSVEPSKLKDKAEEGDHKAKKILSLLDDQSNFLSTIQVAITLSGFFNSAAAATGIAKILSVKLEAFSIPQAESIATVLITLILSYITIVFGELVPKRIALVQSEKFARFAVGTISFAAFIFKPFVKLLSISTNIVLKLLGIDTTDVDAQVTIGDIKSLIKLGENQGIINPVEGEMINSVIGFDNITADEIMTARPEVLMVDINDPIHEYIDDMLELKYSRIPVYDDDVDKIIGVLYLKDFLLESYKVGFDNVNIRKILRKPYFVPERKNINELFNELQSNNRHMALLIDEYGGFSGIVTMEDLIEEIVGDIDDEYDHDEPELIQISENIYIARGSLSIKEFNSKTNLSLDDDSEDYDTLGGFIITELGHIPLDGEKPEIITDEAKYEVLEVKDKRIQEIKVILIEHDEIEDEESTE